MQASGWENVADLRANTDDPRFKRAQHRVTSVVGSDLLVDIADRADQKLLGEKLRSAPIKMPVDTVLITRAWVEEIIGQSGHYGEFVSGLRVEVGVARTAISGAVALSLFMTPPP